MWTFAATIVSTVFIYLLFPSFKRWGVQTSWAITVNYFVAATLGWTLAGGSNAVAQALGATWILPLSLLGAAFYPLFQLTARCSQELGVSVATIASKLSMAIPVLVLAVVDGMDGITWGQWAGMALAFPAVWLSASSGNDQCPESASNEARPNLWWIPVTMFFGSGCIDLMFGWFSTDPSLDAPGMQMAFASVPFTLGGIVGLVDQLRRGMGMPKGRDLLGGLTLGVTNFGSLYFLLLAFDSGLFERAMVVPLLNLSVIVLATVGGIYLLKDIPNQKARWGVVLATASIGLMMLLG
ncbi:MAG: hypothetical protein ACPG66_08660 [Flavobacteriales bacterium]